MTEIDVGVELAVDEGTTTYVGLYATSLSVRTTHGHLRLPPFPFPLPSSSRLSCGRVTCLSEKKQEIRRDGARER